MTRSLPWSIALHLLLAAAIIAASGNMALRSSRFVPGAFVVELRQAASGLNPAKQKTGPAPENISQAKAVPVEKEKAKKHDAVTAENANTQKDSTWTAKEKTKTPTAPPMAVAAGPGPALSSPQTQKTAAIQAQSPGGRQRAALFQNMAVRRNTGMWRPSHMMWRASVLPNPWFDASRETLFLSAVHAKLKSLLARTIKRPGNGPLGGQTAKVILSYGADGKKFTGATVSSGSDALKSLLQGIDWQAAPLPGAYGLSLSGLAITVKVESGVTVTEKAL